MRLVTTWPGQGHGDDGQVGHLDDVATAYRQARIAAEQARLDAAQMVADARAEVERIRVELAAAIVAEHEAGTAQVEIIRRTGYSREQVRTILRRAGVEAD